MGKKETKEDVIIRKIINDPIHGQIGFHPLCIHVIDTPQFQRLRRIKQLGFGYTVYPSAVHNRFSHSLGVSHLAGKFLQELLNNSKDVMINGVSVNSMIDESDILCVEIAGLCHDLGHGPFSHFWEGFMKEVDKQKKEPTNWEHEKMSLILLDHLIQENNLQDLFKKYNVNVEHVKSLIMGNEIQEKPVFLSQIVNNRQSGLDVDKWDYYLRDSYHLGIHCSFEYERLIRYARVIKVAGKYQICFRDKVKPMVYNMFRTRSELHHLAYQHRVVNIMEKMVFDALVKLDLENEKRNVGPLLWKLTTKAVKGETEALKEFCEQTDDSLYSYLISKSNFGSDVVDCIERRSKNENYYNFVTQWNFNETEKKSKRDSSGKRKLDSKRIQENIRNHITKLIPEVAKQMRIVDVQKFHLPRMSLFR